MKTRATCTARKRDGSRCGMPPLRGGRLCWAHSPAVERERAEAQRRGGQARTGALALGDVVVDLSDANAIRRLLELVAAGVLQAKLGVQAARVVVSACNTAVRVHEVADLEERVAALEARRVL